MGVRRSRRSGWQPGEQAVAAIVSGSRLIIMMDYERERERVRERNAHTHTHTHTLGETPASQFPPGAARSWCRGEGRSVATCTGPENPRQNCAL